VAPQEYTSEKTCRSQVPALHKALERARVWRPNLVNSDIGGGKFSKATVYLRTLGVDNIVFDPYNRSDLHNDSALSIITKGVDTATVANVLNVIKEFDSRRDVIQIARFSMVAYFDVYEGDKSGEGKPTRDGWQENRKLATYVAEVKAVFNDVEVQTLGGLRVIVAQ